LCCGKSILWTLQFLVADVDVAAGPNSIANVQQQQEAEEGNAAVSD